jgi:hypothetical protein
MSTFQNAEQQCESGCAMGINCCLTSQLCFNGGTCVPQYSTPNSSRFTCQCTKYFTGKQCQICAEGFTGKQCHICAEGFTGHMCQTRIKSCSGYKNDGRSGEIYNIFDDDRNLFPVLCDFDKDRAWTLIQSYKFENRVDYKISFAKNKPQNEDSPSLVGHRMTTYRMQTIARNSTKWRITCDHRPGEKISYIDYVEASLEKIDLLTFNGNRYSIAFHSTKLSLRKIYSFSNSARNVVGIISN